MANATAQGNAANTRYGGMNQAIQGGTSNALLANNMATQPAVGNYYGAGRVPPGGSFPGSPQATNYGS